MDNNLKKNQYLSVLGLDSNQKSKPNSAVSTNLIYSNSEEEKKSKKGGMKTKSKFVYSIPFSIIILKESLAKPFYGKVEKNDGKFDESFEVLKKTAFISFDYERHCKISKLDIPIEKKKRIYSKSNETSNYIF